MSQSHVEVTRTSWGQRLGGAIKGVVVGIVLVVAGIGLLFWNEGRSVKRAKALTAGAGRVIAIDARHPEPAYDGELVHATGATAVDGTLRDPLFGVETDGLLLARDVEMFQWQEQSTSREEKKLGGGTETITTYDYRTEWSPRPIDSGAFKVREGHENPGRFPFDAEEVWAEHVTLETLELASSFVRSLARRERLDLTEADLESIPDESLRASLRLESGELYMGTDAASPRVGDVRVRFHRAPAPIASVVGEQRGGRLVPHPMPGGQTIALAQHGEVPASEMFAAAQAANRTLAWLLRAGGFLLVFIGLRAVFRPLSVLADVVPAIGSVVGVGTGLVAFVLAACASLVTIAVGWLVYRPLLGIALLLAAGTLAFWLIRKLLQRRAGPVAPAVAMGSAEPTGEGSAAPPAGSAPGSVP